MVSTLDTGVNSGHGNVIISFGTNAIQSFTLRYGSGLNIPNNGETSYQHIAVHDINFTPVPEINPALTAAASCLAVAGLVVFHRARVKSRRQ